VWAAVESKDEAEESARVEPGFPAPGVLVLPDVGSLPYQIAVFKEDVKSRHIPHGVFFTLNGQVQGAVSADFVTRRLKFDYLSGHLLISVDCTAMNEQVREDFFMASRDRVRQDDVYHEIVDKLTAELRDHPGLRELNAQRRKRQLDKALSNEQATIDVLQDLINKDPALAGLFGGGDRLVTSTGPGEASPFEGRRFPTYFRIKGGLVKPCPTNRTPRIEFETDAANDYFTRADSPGSFVVEPPKVYAGYRLWNGRFMLRLQPPADALPGEVIPVEIRVTDIQREIQGGPFICRFDLRVEAPAKDASPKPPGQPHQPRQPSPNGKAAPSLGMPHIIEVTREEWREQKPEEFDELTALRIKESDDGGFDLYVNMDNTFLVTELVRGRRSEDKPLVRYWFKYGLALCALAMLQDVHKPQAAKVRSGTRTNGSEAIATNDYQDPETIGRFCDGLARVVIPIIRNLHSVEVEPPA
jgi:hypothetical protein